jgi:hypothetical protein
MRGGGEEEFDAAGRREGGGGANPRPSSSLANSTLTTTGRGLESFSLTEKNCRPTIFPFSMFLSTFNLSQFDLFFKFTISIQIAFIFF